MMTLKGELEAVVESMSHQLTQWYFIQVFFESVREPHMPFGQSRRLLVAGPSDR